MPLSRRPIQPTVPLGWEASPLEPDEGNTWEEALRPLLTRFGALVFGCLVGLQAALADVATEVENVEAAWGQVQRNYYDQKFNGQDWAALHDRYLDRARKGEKAASITRQMVASLGDRYSRVANKDEFERIMAFDPLGIGVVLIRNDQSEVIVSSPPFAGSASAKAGLKQGDVVLSIDGASFENDSIFKVMDFVSQKDSPQVTLSLRRGSATNPSASWEETLPRVRATTPQNKVDSGVVPGPGGHRVGYVRLKSFGGRSAVDVSEAMKQVQAQGADELVLDLRGNLGGSFQAALETAALFLEPNTVATHVQTPSSGDKPLKVNDNGGRAREPLVLLVDNYSASASEVLSAALRGNCRATLLGSKTYGKAAVQGVFGLPNREALVLTVAKYSGPSGLEIGDGLKPDGPGPVGLLGQAAAATGLAVDISPSDYGNVDFDQASLRSCAPEMMEASSEEKPKASPEKVATV